MFLCCLQFRCIFIFLSLFCKLGSVSAVWGTSSFCLPNSDWRVGGIMLMSLFCCRNLPTNSPSSSLSTSVCCSSRCCCLMSNVFHYHYRFYQPVWLSDVFLLLVEHLGAYMEILLPTYSFHVFSLLIQAAAVRPLLSKTNVCFTLNRLQCVLLASEEFKHWQVLLKFWVFRERKQGSDISCSSPLFRFQENRINGLWRKEWNI